MCAFKLLRDISTNFEEDLLRASTELFTAKIEDTFEDVVAVNLKDLSLFTSKLRLLQAKPGGPQHTANTDDEKTVLSNYTETVKQKLVEKQVVKAVLQAHAVKKLLTDDDSNLSVELVQRKEKILEQLNQFIAKESQLQDFDVVYRERQEQLERARREWDDLLGRLRKMRENVSENSVDDQSTPLYSKFRSVEEKLVTLRWLVASMATARGRGYDWLADPRRRLRALRVARQ